MNVRQTTRIIALALGAQIALSWPLWYAPAGRTFPELPVAGMAALHFPGAEAVQIGVVLLLLGATALFSQKKWLPAGLFAALLWMILQDINRLQPWMYFYLLAFGLRFAAGDNTNAGKRFLQWLLAAVYVWGGFNKITPYFAEDNFPWFCEAFGWTKPFGAFSAAGYAVATGEMLLGPGLLWKKSAWIFRWLAVAFHLFIAVALSPFGLDWNTVVIPWNFAMAGMVWVLFDQKASTRMPVSRKAAGAAGVLLALAWVMPALNVFHCWDEALSWKMYSNTQTEASFYHPDGPPCPRVAAIWTRYAYDGGTKMLFDDWAMADLRVPAYNNRWVHLQLARYLCACRKSTGQTSGLLLFSVNRWNRSAEREERIPCGVWPP